MAIFACEPAGALDAMESVKQNRLVPRRNPNTLADGLRTSLGELPLLMLRRHMAGFFAVGERGNWTGNALRPMSDSRW
jgi:threonine dehydratase